MNEKAAARLSCDSLRGGAFYICLCTLLYSS